MTQDMRVSRRDGGVLERLNPSIVHFSFWPVALLDGKEGIYRGVWEDWIGHTLGMGTLPLYQTVNLTV